MHSTLGKKITAGLFAVFLVHRAHLRGLNERLKRAEVSGASHVRKMLIADHLAWMREFLGAEKFEKYREISQLSAD